MDGGGKSQTSGVRNCLSVFNSIVAIGDSQTEGCFNTKDDYYIDKHYSWPSYLEKINGCRVKNWGSSGLTTKGWYECYIDSVWKGFDCAIIQLGINDVFKEEQKYTKEYLGRIINKLQRENPGIKIFVSTIVKSEISTSNKFNHLCDTIRDFVADSPNPNLYLVDIYRYGHTMDLNGYNAGHFTALGHLRLAEDYCELIGLIINKNSDSFSDIQFCGTLLKPYDRNKRTVRIIIDFLRRYASEILFYVLLLSFIVLLIKMEIEFNE